ncbi:MAG: DUF86 domain-containing protein [ANME-2 cluster archaeon]|nr:DUF86 domain-containing protein [ANME-2 cluster archaeon]
MKHDDVLIKHILDEIEFLKQQSQNINLENLMVNEVLKRAFARSIEIIGEASKNLSETLKAKYPEIEWKKIAGMRDKLIHAYFGIDWEIVWDVIVNRLPKLETDINALNEREFNR